MKKIIIVVGLIFLASGTKADIGDQIKAALLEHVAVVTQFRSGETKLALVDSVVQIGHINGKSIFDLQAGFNGGTKPEAGRVQAADFVAGGILKIRQGVTYSDNWKFLNALEYGPYLQYDFRRDEWYGGLQAGLAFGLDPVH